MTNTNFVSFGPILLRIDMITATTVSLAELEVADEIDVDEMIS